MQNFKTLGPEASGPALKTPLMAVFACWISAAALFLALDTGKFVVAFATYAISTALATAACAVTALRSEAAERVFWAGLCGALGFRLLGYAGWSGHRFFEAESLWLYNAAHAASYLLLFASLMWLVAHTTRSITVIVALDALCIMLSVGMLGWYFVLGPYVGADDWGEVLLTVLHSRFAGDTVFLFLVLVTLSTSRRLPFSAFLGAAFIVFLVSDILYLGSHAYGGSSPIRPSEFILMAWSLGFMFLALGALKAISSGRFERQFEIHPWRVFAFWFGPLSPAIHYAVLLGWGALHPPLPSYALWGGVVMTAYFAFRISYNAYVNRKLRLEAQRLAVRGEQGRISEELHESLKQNVYGVSLLLDAYKEAKEDEDPGASEILESVIEASREANYQVSRPIEELRARWAGPDTDPAALLDQLLRDVENQFGIKPHQDLRADLTRFTPVELAAAYRIASEALWNAAKHSGARNVWLESREAGSLTLLRVRDDGRGFSHEDATGYGLHSMRSRAEESGGTLDIISGPRSGTTVQVRFEKG